MPRTSKYTKALEEYDPDLHGTMKAYCQSLNIDYDSFRQAASKKKRKEGIAPRKLSDYSAYYGELLESNEPIKEFCERNDLNYKNFRISFYRYRKALGIDTSRKKKAKETEEEIENENQPGSENEKAESSEESQD